MNLLTFQKKCARLKTIFKIIKSIFIRINRLSNVSSISTHNHNHAVVSISIHIYNHSSSTEESMNLFANRMRKNFLSDVEKKIRRDSKACFYCDENDHFVKNCFHKFAEIRSVSIIAIFSTFNSSDISAFVRKMQRNE